MKVSLKGGILHCIAGGFYEKDKARLANIMAYGEDLPPPDVKKVQRKIAGDDFAESRLDRFDECKFTKLTRLTDTLVIGTAVILLNKIKMW